MTLGRSWGAALLACGAALAAFGPLLAGAFLELSDGRILEGEAVERDGDLYMLRIAGGAVIPVPIELVTKVGVSEEPGRREAPTGIRAAAPEILAGDEIIPPNPADQTAVLGPPAEFQGDVVRSNLHPSYWVMDPSQHNFNPSTWQDGVIDPNWEPESAFDANKDVLESGRSTFKKSIVDSSWKPTDGFAK